MPVFFFTKLVNQNIKETSPKWFPFLMENNLPHTSTTVNISVLWLEGPIKNIKQDFALQMKYIQLLTNISHGM